MQGRTHESQVDAALVQQVRQGLHRVFARADVDAGVAGAKAGELALQHAGIGGRGDIADLQASQLAAPGPPRHFLRLRQLRQRARRLQHEQFAGRRQGHGALAALEQPRTEQAFRFLHLLGQRGRRNAQLDGGAREVQAVRDGQHAAEMPQLQGFFCIHHE